MAYKDVERYKMTLQRLGLILVRNDIKRVFSDGNEACVLYDFVTNTSSGAVPMVEWISFEDGLIRSIKLYFDREAFAGAQAELGRLAAAAS